VSFQAWAENFFLKQTNAHKKKDRKRETERERWEMKTEVLTGRAGTTLAKCIFEKGFYKKGSKE